CGSRWHALPFSTGNEKSPARTRAVSIEHFSFSPNRENALSLCFYAIPDAKPLRIFAGIALVASRPVRP
ncbi:MAG TPA: hypothetical protein VD840_12545, partial [Sinorhizobium sp.]|nr:hypothetical protein [Sinorhizobium sp.]